MADSAVRIWDVRGAFDESLAVFSAPLLATIPFPLEAVRVTLARRALLDDVATAVHPSAATCILIALTERGHSICMSVRTNGWAMTMREIGIVDDALGRDDEPKP